MQVDQRHSGRAEEIRKGHRRAVKASDIHSAQDKREAEGGQTLRILREGKRQAEHPAVYHQAGLSRTDLQQVCRNCRRDRVQRMIAHLYNFGHNFIKYENYTLFHDENHKLIFFGSNYRPGKILFHIE